jgi:hypothetical protein
MTRHGTLAYYLAAWVIGGFVVAIPYLFATGPISPSALLMTYFFALIIGLVGLLLFAFLLRLVMRPLDTHILWIWVLVGAAISSALVSVLAIASERRPAALQSGLPLTIASMILGGAEAIRQTGIWQAPVDGAATGLILCLVDRAFARTDANPANPTEPAPETKQSAV